MFSSFNSGFNGFAAIPQKFEDYFRCFPVAMMPDNVRKDDANYGGKIFLPPSALSKLTMLHIRYPMLFELLNENENIKTFSGVLEFVAEEGRCYLPQWMMSTLHLQPGSVLKVSNKDVPLGKFVKIEPQSVDFLDISDPKAVLENVLRKFSTLTVDDVIEINYNNKSFGIKVLEVKPESVHQSICVVETDLETDFAPPVGYVEPDYKAMQEEKKKQKPKTTSSMGTMAHSIKFADIAQSVKPVTFKGEGQKVSGKATKAKVEETKIEEVDFSGEPAPLTLPHGQLFFGFPVIPVTRGDEPMEEAQTGTFIGQGQSLRQSKKRKDVKAHQSQKPKVQSPEVIEID